MALLTMKENVFLDFYKDTFLGYSKAFLKKIATELENEGLITFDEQLSLGASESNPIYFLNKRAYKNIVSVTTSKKQCIPYYEKLEFTKLYKYSMPLFFDTEEDLAELLKNIEAKEYLDQNFMPEFVLGASFCEAKPVFYQKNDKLFIKFTWQKGYVNQDQEQINYRYTMVVYFDFSCKVLEIRYDSIRYHRVDKNVYEQNIYECLQWLKDVLKLRLYYCEHRDAMGKIKTDESGKVKIFRQMMELDSGGAADLTAAKDGDYCLPFLGEIKELIDENGELFDTAPEIKKLLIEYIEDKEATAQYPYIYIKWIEPIETDSYTVKVTFDMISMRYTVLQHVTGTCRDLGMERMNHALEYLCSNGAFIKGEEI